MGMTIREKLQLLSAAVAPVNFCQHSLFTKARHRCHPDFAFPAGWHITHSSSHWTTSETFMEFCVHIVIPYITKYRTSHNCPNQHGLLILDVFRAHQDEASLNLLKDNLVEVCFVPPNLTSDLQPNDQVQSD